VAPGQVFIISPGGGGKAGGNNQNQLIANAGGLEAVGWRGAADIIHREVAEGSQL